jgi:hypothetical protein
MPCSSESDVSEEHIASIFGVEAKKETINIIWPWTSEAFLRNVGRPLPNYVTLQPIR